MSSAGCWRARRHGKAVGFSVPAVCLLVYGGVLLASGLSPRYREDWILENVPTIVVLPAAVLAHRRTRFSDRACVQALIFGILHAVGSHYTYSEVPLGDWLREVFRLERNHYDRVVHFAFGVLAVRPFRELAFPTGSRLGVNRELTLTLAAVVCVSALYEVVEWLVASVADPAAGTAFLGTQGDVWDAQKDMSLALLGALIALAVEVLGEAR